MAYLEKHLVNQCIHYLNLKGHFVWRNNSGVTKMQSTDRFGRVKERQWRAGIKGGSDIIGIHKNGKFLAVECKIGKNKPTMAQTEFLEEVEARNGIALIAYDLEDLENNKNL